MEVLKGRCFALVATPDKVVVDLGGAAVDDRLFFGRELACTDQLFAQGQQKFGLQDHRVLPITVALFHIHGVDVVGRSR